MPRNTIVWRPHSLFSALIFVGQSYQSYSLSQIRAPLPQRGTHSQASKVTAEHHHQLSIDAIISLHDYVAHDQSLLARFSSIATDCNILASILGFEVARLICCSLDLQFCCKPSQVSSGQLFDSSTIAWTDSTLIFWPVMAMTFIEEGFLRWLFGYPECLCHMNTVTDL